MKTWILPIQRVLFSVVITMTLSFLFLPLLSVFIGLQPAEFFLHLRSQVALEAMKLSIITTCIALLINICFGTPLAYFLAMYHFKGKSILDVCIQLPIVIPPAVAGLGLILVFGRFGLLGNLFSAFGIQITFTEAAVVFAQVFISAPFFIANAKTAFASVDKNLIEAAKTLGSSKLYTFIKIVLPLSLPGLITGAALSWARALGEFGATIMFAGNLPGKTQTMPLAIYSVMESDLQIAVALSALLVIVAFCLMLTVKLVERYRFNLFNIRKKDTYQ